jgi:hypothetical protein
MEKLFEFVGMKRKKRKKRGAEARGESMKDGL